MSVPLTGTKAIVVGEEELVLLPEKALWLPEYKALLLADLHLGKAGHFRKHGLGIPSDGGKHDLSRLDSLVEIVNPECLYLLGDLFHSDINEEWNAVHDWFTSVQCRKVLVEGNHDIFQEKIYLKAGLEVMKVKTLGQLILTHEPMENVPAGFLNIAGHIHPGVKLQGKARQSLRLPCFHRQKSQLILPAFGRLTGLYLLPPKEGDEIFAIADDQVIQVL